MYVLVRKRYCLKMQLNSFISIVTTVGFLISGVITASESSDSADYSTEVTLQQGKLRGLRLTSRKGNPYFGFLGVPYAKAVVRFGLPEEPDSWKGTKSAENFAPKCFQLSFMERAITGEEDCLTLNVYTRKLDGKAPVIVEIHGGGFQFGSGSEYEAKYFMDEDVLLVTIQYRLGALGFLNMGDDTVPGNIGLRDQTAALKWVQKNIHQFGGDPNLVTISGESAGGASVHYQMLSTMSKGLFSAAISRSGSALNPWAFQESPRKYALLLANNVGCLEDTNEGILKCLKEKPAGEIVHGQLKIGKLPPQFHLLRADFTPSVERGSSSERFLSDTPYKLMEKGEITTRVPWIAGICRDEGAISIANIVENEKDLETLNKDYAKIFPYVLYYEDTSNPEDFESNSEKAWNYYIQKEKVTAKDHLQLGRLYGDRSITNGVYRAIKVHAGKNHFPIYPFVFSHMKDHSVTQGLAGAKHIYGVTHADELKYLFNSTYGGPDYKIDTDEGQFSEKFVKLLVSFATDLKPTFVWGPKWEQLKLSKEDDNIPWYEIDTEPNILTEDPFKERNAFWESLPIREMAKEDITHKKDEL